METIEVEPRKSKLMPLGVPFILFYIGVVRYGSSGIIGTLAIFANQKLKYDEDTSTALVHYYMFALYSFAIFGSIISDSCLGRYKTLIYMSLLYAIGTTIVGLGTVQPLNVSVKLFALIGFIIIIIGAGCGKPPIITYGADQYVLPFDAKGLTLYFSLNYMVTNGGSIVGRIVSPYFRDGITCFGGDDCYLLIYGIPSLMILVSVVALMIGKRFSILFPPGGNMIGKVFGCIWTAISVKFSKRSTSPKENWLDYAEEKYGPNMVADSKIIVNVFIVMLALIPFSTLFLQQFSRWVFQAVKMNGDLGFYQIPPDQMTVLNPLLTVILIPFCDYVLYPIIAKVGLKTAFHKVGLGFFLTTITFVISAILQYFVENYNVHILWQIPQYVIISFAEVLIEVPFSEFGHTEAPESMKSILQAFGMLMVAVGNLIAALITGARFVDSQMIEFLIFAGIMAMDTIIFVFLAKRYKSAKVNVKESYCEEMEKINKD